MSYPNNGIRKYLDGVDVACVSTGKGEVVGLAEDLVIDLERTGFVKRCEPVSVVDRALAALKSALLG